MERVVEAVKRSRAGFREPDKPVASLLFVGPTGVGKTELARQLAATLGVPLLRYDMSEYQEKHTVAKFVGAPSGLRRLRGGRPPHRGGAEEPARGSPAGRDREGARGHLQHAPPGHGLRDADRQQRQEGGFPQRGPAHDLERRRPGDRPADHRLRGAAHQPGRRLQGAGEDLLPRVQEPPGRRRELPAPHRRGRFCRS